MLQLPAAWAPCSLLDEGTASAINGAAGSQPAAVLNNLRRAQANTGITRDIAAPSSVPACDLAVALGRQAKGNSAKAPAHAAQGDNAAQKSKRGSSGKVVKGRGGKLAVSGDDDFDSGGKAAKGKVRKGRHKARAEASSAEASPSKKAAADEAAPRSHMVLRARGRAAAWAAALDCSSDSDCVDNGRRARAGSGGCASTDVDAGGPVYSGCGVYVTLWASESSTSTDDEPSGYRARSASTNRSTLPRSRSLDEGPSGHIRGRGGREIRRAAALLCALAADATSAVRTAPEATAPADTPSPPPKRAGGNGGMHKRGRQGRATAQRKRRKGYDIERMSSSELEAGLEGGLQASDRDASVPEDAHVHGSVLHMQGQHDKPSRPSAAARHLPPLPPLPPVKPGPLHCNASVDECWPVHDQHKHASKARPQQQRKRTANVVDLTVADDAQMQDYKHERAAHWRTGSAGLNGCDGQWPVAGGVGWTDVGRGGARAGTGGSLARPVDSPMCSGPWLCGSWQVRSAFPMRPIRELLPIMQKSLPQGQFAKGIAVPQAPCCGTGIKQAGMCTKHICFNFHLHRAACRCGCSGRPPRGPAPKTAASRKQYTSMNGHRRRRRRVT